MQNIFIFGGATIILRPVRRWKIYYNPTIFKIFIFVHYRSRKVSSPTFSATKIFSVVKFSATKIFVINNSGALSIRRVTVKLRTCLYTSTETSEDGLHRVHFLNKFNARKHLFRPATFPDQTFPACFFLELPALCRGMVISWIENFLRWSIKNFWTVTFPNHNFFWPRALAQNKNF